MAHTSHSVIPRAAHTTHSSIFVSTASSSTHTASSHVSAFISHTCSLHTRSHLTHHHSCLIPAQRAHSFTQHHHHPSHPVWAHSHAGSTHTPMSALLWSHSPHSCTHKVIIRHPAFMPTIVHTFMLHTSSIMASHTTQQLGPVNQSFVAHPGAGPLPPIVTLIPTQQQAGALGARPFQPATVPGNWLPQQGNQGPFLGWHCILLHHSKATIVQSTQGVPLPRLVFPRQLGPPGIAPTFPATIVPIGGGSIRNLVATSICNGATPGVLHQTPVAQSQGHIVSRARPQGQLRKHKGVTPKVVSKIFTPKSNSFDKI